MEQIIVVTRCDMCQVEGGSSEPLFVDANKQVRVIQRGIWNGPQSEAELNGWVETDFGVVCSECAEIMALEEEKASLEQVKHGAATVSQLAAVLAPENALGAGDQQGGEDFPWEER